MLEVFVYVLGKILSEPYRFDLAVLGLNHVQWYFSIVCMLS